MLKGFSNDVTEWSISPVKSVGDKQLDGLILRASRWRWCEQLARDRSGYQYRIYLDEEGVRIVLRNSGFKWKDRSPEKTIAYRLKKLVKIGYLRKRGRSGYDLTDRADPLSGPLLKKSEELQRAFRENPRQQTGWINDAFNQIIPGAGKDFEFSVINKWRSDLPPLWDRTERNSFEPYVSMTITPGVLMFILQLAVERTRQLDPDTDEDN